ncbi:fatty acid desaturase [Paraferrimonas sp. SM1919]|uniref:acyl-CoA desaturase n=1 Tax=Paraferrimonas sp. SM1919 TaxID=2662263 RepID=UPI0013CFC1E9|nr:fatty acid desaturase [Paraferrimonas sp. SM1919]
MEVKEVSSKPPLLWVNIIFFISTTIAALILAPLWLAYNSVDASIWIGFVILVFYSGMSITGGYHRLWSHKAYNAHWSVRLVYALGGALALQNSILHWSSDHRQHHKHVDREPDPYSAANGLFFSHIGWMLREYQASNYHDYSNAKDLQKDSIVAWQHKHYLALVILMNVALPLAIGALLGDAIAGLLVLGALRLVLVQHSTFAINSFAHKFGKQKYSDLHSAKDNGFLALLTFGEGYHNFHHTFQFDYRNGIAWWHYDPTKWLIKGLSLCGLASNLKKISEEKILAAKAKMQLQAADKFLTKHNAIELLDKLTHEYEAMSDSLNQIYLEKKRLLSVSKHKWDKQAKRQYQELMFAYKQQLSKWQLLLASTKAQALA